ncbi:MAG: hypothetical protein JRE40_06445, partial [Deltaproteobacteria bacterium]|nr:hypothetical protein [Deltaproteobacteria bacterium]
GRTLASDDYFLFGSDDVAKVTLVNGLAANVITTASINDDAITAAKIAANAIGASELADNALTEDVTSAGFVAEMVTAGGTALADINLNYLMSEAAGEGDIGAYVDADSVIGIIVDADGQAGGGGYWSWDRTSHSLEGLGDKIDTAQADLDTLTGSDGATLATAQSNYAPAKAGDLMGLSDDAITTAKVTDAAWQELIELFFSFDAAGDYGDQPGSVVDQIADNAGSGSAPTVEQIRAEMDNNSTQLAAIVEDTGTTLPGLISAIGGGDGSVVVDHDTGGTDALTYKTAAGVGIDNAVVRAYLKSDYDAGSTGSEYIKATTTTDVNGRWTNQMNLDPATYTLYYFKQGAYGPDTQEVTVE